MPVCAAINFYILVCTFLIEPLKGGLDSGGQTRGKLTFRSPTVSSESHLIRTFFPSRSFAMTSIITIVGSGQRGESTTEFKAARGGWWVTEFWLRRSYRDYISDFPVGRRRVLRCQARVSWLEAIWFSVSANPFPHVYLPYWQIRFCLVLSFIDTNSSSTLHLKLCLTLQYLNMDPVDVLKQRVVTERLHLCPIWSAETTGDYPVAGSGRSSIQRGLHTWSEILYVSTYRICYSSSDILYINCERLLAKGVTYGGGDVAWTDVSYCTSMRKVDQWNLSLRGPREGWSSLRRPTHITPCSPWNYFEEL